MRSTFFGALCIAVAFVNASASAEEQSYRDMPGGELYAIIQGEYTPQRDTARYVPEAAPRETYQREWSPTPRVRSDTEYRRPVRTYRRVMVRRVASSGRSCKFGWRHGNRGLFYLETCLRS